MPTLRITGVQNYCRITGENSALGEHEERFQHPTHIQGLQAVPAERVLAVLAHHLCAALVPLDVDFAFWTPLDRRVVFLVLVKRAGKEKG